ncbi:MAG: Maf family protein [Clostridiales bacterium]|jgi:septum formation protein|nr:Maf family protein [Clostridiales bacterium]
MRIILASGSPRRIELLDQFNIDFDVVPSKIEEVTRPHETPVQAVMALAFEKANDVANMYPDAVIIASDTIVYKDDILGKPSSRADAKAMLNNLNGEKHDVYTGIALVYKDKSICVVDYEKTTVTFNYLTEEQIEKYLDTNEPLDKAGAYGIQGIGALLVKKIDGDYFNVMGLPLSKLSQLLKKYFQIDLL